MKIYTVTLNDGQQFFMKLDSESSNPVKVKFHTIDLLWHSVNLNITLNNSVIEIANQLSEFYYAEETDDYAVANVEETPCSYEWLYYSQAI